MKTFRLSHALTVWAAVLAALALLSACDSPVATTTETGVMLNETPKSSIKFHKWQICGTKIEHEKLCPNCSNLSEPWMLAYMLSSRGNDTMVINQPDTVQKCSYLGTFADTTRFLGLYATWNDSLHFRIDDTIVKPFVWRTRMNPDSVGYKAWGEK